MMIAATNQMSTKVKIPLFISCTLGTLFLGFVVGLVSGSMNGYAGLIMPPLSPPDLVFPIVWAFLYIAMGISLYLTLTTPAHHTNEIITKKTATWLWIAQLTFNLCWPFAFFLFKIYAFAFVWLCILCAINLAYIIVTFPLNKGAAALMIPYQAWLFFAAYLNLYIALLN